MNRLPVANLTAAEMTSNAPRGALLCAVAQRQSVHAFGAKLVLARDVKVNCYLGPGSVTTLSRSESEPEARRQRRNIGQALISMLANAFDLQFKRTRVSVGPTLHVELLKCCSREDLAEVALCHTVEVGGDGVLNRTTDLGRGGALRVSASRWAVGSIGRRRTQQKPRKRLRSPAWERM